MIKMFSIETIVILIISFIVNFAIVGVFADPKYQGKTVLLSNVGEYLRENLGGISVICWGVGLLASGLSSTTSGALAGQYLMEGIFDLKISKFKRILITR